MSFVEERWDSDPREHRHKLAGATNDQENRLLAIESFSAYGGMQYSTDAAPVKDVGPTWEQIVLYDTATPINTPPVGVTFLSATSELQIDTPGVFRITFLIDAEAEQGGTYVFALRVDSGAGPIQVGPPFYDQVHRKANYMLLQVSEEYRFAAGDKISVWVMANTPNRTFEAYTLEVSAMRIAL